MRFRGLVIVFLLFAGQYVVAQSFDTASINRYVYAVDKGNSPTYEIIDLSAVTNTAYDGGWQVLVHFDTSGAVSSFMEAIGLSYGFIIRQYYYQSGNLVYILETEKNDVIPDGEDSNAPPILKRVYTCKLYLNGGQSISVSEGKQLMDTRGCSLPDFQASLDLIWREIEMIKK